MHDMIAVLDAFVYPGSELWLYNEVGILLVMCCKCCVCKSICDAQR